MPIHPTDFLNQFARHGIEFFAGVPDSLLKEFCLCVDDHVPNDTHIITANEGNAIALASGFYLANKSLPLVYMQNSGLGNAVNPLLSLCDPDVYSIPLLVMIGWRGEPGVKDEPQHVKQGKIQVELLESMGIPFETFSKNDTDFDLKISRTAEKAINESRPVVLLIKKGTFEPYGKKPHISDVYSMGREEALEIILENLHEKDIVVSTTGKTSREIFEIRENKDDSHERDFLTVGSMGHCSSIALGIALAKPQRNVICIDGDGAMIMHLGSLTSIASLQPKNFHHILINNEVHESVGGQETAAKNIDLSYVVKSMGIKNMYKAQSTDELINCLNHFLSSNGPSFLEVKVRPGSRDDLGRPTITPVENKKNFMAFLDK